MSKIDTLIKQLQASKKKVDYVNYLHELIKNDKNSDSFKDVKKEILDLLVPVFAKMVSDIENNLSEDLPPQQTAGPSGLTADEMAALKMTAQAVLQRNGKAPVGNSPFSNPNNPVPPKQKINKASMSNQDKMGFAMNNRHLANKSVNILDDNGRVVGEGKVVGLDAPCVVVQVAPGQAIDVPIEKIQVL